jgi:hypothetical protein
MAPERSCAGHALKKKKTPGSFVGYRTKNGRHYTEVVVPKEPKPDSEYQPQPLILFDDFTVETDGKSK